MILCLSNNTSSNIIKFFLLQSNELGLGTSIFALYADTVIFHSPLVAISHAALIEIFSSLSILLHASNNLIIWSFVNLCLKPGISIWYSFCCNDLENIS